MSITISVTFSSVEDEGDGNMEGGICLEADQLTYDEICIGKEFYKLTNGILEMLFVKAVQKEQK